MNGYLNYSAAEVQSREALRFAEVECILRFPGLGQSGLSQKLADARAAYIWCKYANLQNSKDDEKGRKLGREYLAQCVKSPYPVLKDWSISRHQEAQIQVALADYLISCSEPFLENNELALELAKAGSAVLTDDEGALRTLGTVAYRNDRFAEALAAAEAARRESMKRSTPSDPYYWFLEALSQEKLKHHTEALAAFEQGEKSMMHFNSRNAEELRKEAAQCVRQ